MGQGPPELHNCPGPPNQGTNCKGELGDREGVPESNRSYMSLSSFAAYGTAGLPREVQNFPPGLIPMANRRGAVDTKIDVGRNKELRLLTPIYYPVYTCAT